jgi:hypothetical protein
MASSVRPKNARWPTPQAQVRTKRSTAEESTRALTKLQKSPRAKTKLPNMKSTISPSQSPCKNTPLKTRRSPTRLHTPARRWPALVGYAGQWGVSTAYLRGRRSPRGGREARGSDSEAGGGAASSQRRSIGGNGAGVPEGRGSARTAKRLGELR